MDKYKLLEKIKNNPHSTNFNDFVKCIEKFGFEKIQRKTSGSHHHKYFNDTINEILNIQPVKGKAKDYQIKQFVEIVEKFNL